MKSRLWLTIILFLTLCCERAFSQDIFFGEVGLTGGCGYVLGDRNKYPFTAVEPLGGAFVRYKFNGYWELRLQAEGGLLGVVPDGENKKRAFGDVMFLGEFNFFNYGVEKWQPHRSWVTPTIVAGIGMLIFDEHVTMTIPFGIGVKFKLSNRVNVGAYWLSAKTFSDALDYEDNPLGLNGSWFNNRDWYSTLQAYLSINFGKTCAPCRNRARSLYEQSKNHRR